MKNTRKTTMAPHLASVVTFSEDEVSLIAVHPNPIVTRQVLLRILPTNMIQMHPSKTMRRARRRTTRRTTKK
jgi:hypothetical protein